MTDTAFVGFCAREDAPRPAGVTITRSEYVGRLESRIRLRLDFITKTLGIERVEPDMSDREFEALAAKVDNYLQVINDR